MWGCKMRILEQFTKNNFIQTAKKQKLTFDKFIRLFRYSAYRHIKTTINHIPYCGYVYRLCEYTTTPQDIETAIKEYNNIFLYKTCSQFAPEQKHIWLFIANKPIKGVNEQ